MKPPIKKVEIKYEILKRFRAVDQDMVQDDCWLDLPRLNLVLKSNLMIKESSVKFTIGQIIHHKMFDYRGVVVDVDPVFNSTQEWYEKVALSRPPKDKPWYHVLVDGATHQTYVAEKNLEADESGKPIKHPLVGEFFSGVKQGIYVMRQRSN